MQVRDLIDKHFSILATFSKVNLIPKGLIADFEIYEFYRRLDEKKSKMLRYSITADAKCVTEDKVRRVVREMEKEVVNLQQ